jgi:DNA ligase-1
MKPLLATDYDESKLVFPIGVQPKIDGVRGLTTEGHLTGRSLKKHKNRFTTLRYSLPEYADSDGEIAAQHECHPDLCRITSSALGTIKGEPYTLWHLFDAVNKHVVKAEYYERYKWLENHIKSEHQRGNMQFACLVPMQVVANVADLRLLHARHLDLGYEGTILRNLTGKRKEGRSTVLEGLLLRIKDFIEAEFVITGITEGDANGNDAQINELGQTFRSSHQANKVPNGMIGSFQGTSLGFVTDPQTGLMLIEKDQPLTVSPGKMDHQMRKHYFENQHLLIGKIAKFKFFPKGIKDKPRFPTFVSLRSPEDMS